MPVNRMYPSVTSNIVGEDFIALLMGEVSGNWTNTGARPGESRQLAEAVGSDANSGGGPDQMDIDVQFQRQNWNGTENAGEPVKLFCTTCRTAGH